MSIPQTPSPLSNIIAAKTYNAAWFSGSTKEAQITAAIAAAATDGALYVYVPANMLPYIAANITFNTAVRMIREGGDGLNYDVRAYGAAGNGITDDTIAINAANAGATASGNCNFPPGTYLITSALTLTAAVIFSNGAKLSINIGISVRIIGALTAQRTQIFTGLGTVSFRATSLTQGFAINVDRVFPEWWGGFPGDGLVNIVDCGPAFQSAVRSGSRRISLTEGVYVIQTQILVNEDPTAPNDLIIEGITRTGTYLLAGPVAGSYGAINAMFVNKQNNGKLTFRRLRWSGSGFATAAFLGYGIYALENGATSQAIFSGEIDDCWIGLGTSAAGFFYGGLNNYLVSNCTIEAMKDRFMLVGSGNADIHFSNISEFGCYGPLVDMSSDTIIKNIISITGIHVYSPQDRALIRATNCDALIIDDITYQMNDPVVGGTLGILDLVNCRRLQVSNIKALRYPGTTANMNRVIKLNACSGKLNDVYVDGGDYQLELQGNLNLDITNSTFINASSFNARFVALTFGRVRFANCRLQYSLNGTVNYQVDNSTNDLIFEDCDLLDACYGVGAVASYGNYLSTGGRLRFIDGRLGRTTNIALGTAWVALTPYVEGDIRSDGGNNYICINAHTSSAAGAGGNEPGVGATYTTYWQKYVSIVNSYLFLAGTGTCKIEGTELIDTSILLKNAGSTMAIASQRWANAIQNQSADKGDTSPTITQWTDPETIRFATNLTANRVVTLAWIAGTVGKFRVVRTGLGAFNLDVGGLKTIVGAVAAFVDVEFDGATARLTGYGTL